MDPELANEIKELYQPISVKEFNKRNLSREFNILSYLSSGSNVKEQLVFDKRYRHLNRYSDVLAFRHSIVTLDDKELSVDNYINANYVNNRFTKKENNNLILTQGPLPETTEDFWVMVENEGCEMIVCIVEADKVGLKCHKYWPDKTSKTKEHSISTKQEEDNSIFIRNKIQLKSLKTTYDKAVDHYHFFNWLDFSTLSEGDTEEFLLFIEKMYKKKQECKGPIVIHCSAGIGRSGTLAAIFNIYDYWQQCKASDEEFKISVFDVVRLIRKERYGSVQTLQQYRFIYSMVKKFK